MELVLVAVSVASLFTNIWVIRKMREGRTPEMVYLLPPPREEPIVEPVLEAKADSAPVQSHAPYSYSAWTNRKGIAWDEFSHPHEAPIQKEERGPMERPAGFV